MAMSFSLRKNTVIAQVWSYVCMFILIGPMLLCKLVPCYMGQGKELRNHNTTVTRGMKREKNM